MKLYTQIIVIAGNCLIRNNSPRYLVRQLWSTRFQRKRMFKVCQKCINVHSFCIYWQTHPENVATLTVGQAIAISNWRLQNIPLQCNKLNSQNKRKNRKQHTKILLAYSVCISIVGQIMKKKFHVPILKIKFFYFYFAVGNIWAPYAVMTVV